MRLFGAITEVIIRIQVVPESIDRFHKKYAVATGESSRENPAVYVRQKGGFINGITSHISIKGPEWVYDSLEKLGWKSSSKKGDYSHNDLFWQLIDYGFRLGKNEKIPFENK